MHSKLNETRESGPVHMPVGFGRDTRGSLALWTGLLALPLALSVGVAMDIQRAGRDHSTLKATLDAAVLAAVNNNAIDDAERKAFAEKAFHDGHTGAPVIRLEAAVEDGAVSLEATVRTDLTLSSMVGLTELEVSSRSTAYLNTPDVICALALNKEAEAAISFTGNVDFDAPSCSLQSNSSHPNAISSTGSVIPLAKNFCAYGGTYGPFVPGGTGECVRVEDPYADLRLPESSSCDSNKTAADSYLEVADISDVLAAPAAAAVNLPVEVSNLSTADLQSVPKSVVEAELTNLIPDLEDGVEKNGNYYEFESDDELPASIQAISETGDSEEARVEQSQLLQWILDRGGDLGLPAGDPLSSLPADPSLGGAVNVDTPVAEVSLDDGTVVVIDNDDSAMLVDNDALLAPGTYCGGLTVAGADVTLLPGVYHIVDGPFVVKDTASVVANGVSIVLGGTDSHFKVESDGRLSMKAPKQGVTKGLAVTRDSRRPAIDPATEKPQKLVSRVASGGRLSVTGTVHLPDQRLEVTGNGSRVASNAPSTSFIADTLHFGGSGMIDIRVDHQAADLPPVEPRSEDGARLVE